MGVDIRFHVWVEGDEGRRRTEIVRAYDARAAALEVVQRLDRAGGHAPSETVVHVAIGGDDAVPVTFRVVRRLVASYEATLTGGRI